MFLYNHQIIFCHFFQDVNLDSFGIQCYQCRINVYIGSTLGVQLRQFKCSFIQLFMKHMHALMSWPEDMKISNSKIKFCFFFSCSVNFSQINFFLL